MCCEYGRNICVFLLVTQCRVQLFCVLSFSLFVLNWAIKHSTTEAAMDLCGLLAMSDKMFCEYMLPVIDK